MIPNKSTTQFNTSPPKLNRPLRILISLAVLLHLTAVCLPPFTFATSMRSDTASPLALALANFFRPYVDAAYLGHGYAFFAPDPGPSHLIRCEFEFPASQDKTIETLPDLDRHWPRLLYHRYFMLAESLHAGFVPPDPPPSAPEIISANAQQIAWEHQNWKRLRNQYEAQMRAYKARLLSAQADANRVRITRLEHLLVSPFEFRQNPQSIHDERLFVPLMEESIKPLTEESTP